MIYRYSLPVQQLLKLFADPTRVRILLALEAEELAVNELADVLGMGQSRISNHHKHIRPNEWVRATCVMFGLLVIASILFCGI